MDGCPITGDGGPASPPVSLPDRPAVFKDFRGRKISGLVKNSVLRSGGVSKTGLRPGERRLPIEP